VNHCEREQRHHYLIDIVPLIACGQRVDVPHELIGGPSHGAETTRAQGHNHLIANQAFGRQARDLSNREFVSLASQLEPDAEIDFAGSDLEVSASVRPAAGFSHLEQTEPQQSVEYDLDVRHRHVEDLGDPPRVGPKPLDVRELKDGTVQPDGDQRKGVGVERQPTHRSARDTLRAELCRVLLESLGAHTQSPAEDFGAFRRETALASEPLRETRVIHP
jgi:hypothetical protein